MRWKTPRVEARLKIHLPCDSLVQMCSLSHHPQGSEITVTMHSDQAVRRAGCEAVLGPLQQGLFAGLEYLGKGEPSSSNLDIETDEHIRFAPDPLKVTMPLMAFVTDRASVAMSWDDMTLQPVYATPNFFDGTADHRMTLQGRDVSGCDPVRPESAGGIDRLGRAAEGAARSPAGAAHDRTTERNLPGRTQRSAEDAGRLGTLRAAELDAAAVGRHGVHCLATER